MITKGANPGLDSVARRWLGHAGGNLGNVGSNIGGGRRVESSCKPTSTVAVSSSFDVLAEYPESTTTKQQRRRQQQQRYPATTDSTYQLNFFTDMAI